MPEDFGLGRLAAPDANDHGFLMAAVLPAAPPPSVDYKYWSQNGWWGDQNGYPQCVGYGWAHYLEDGPITHSGPAPVVAPQYIYDEAQKVDEWAGTPHDGTSVRAGAKVLQAEGRISEYRWAFDIDTVVNALLTTGPVVVGTNWYRDMFYPDAKTGLIKVSGALAGGHCYVLNGANRKTKLIRGKNSWSRDWGKRGNFYITFDDMDRLIKEDGEACLAVEVK